MTKPQTARMHALMSDHDAVASVELDAGLVSLVARDAGGAIASVEVLDAVGARLEPPAAFAALARARAQALRLSDQAAEHALALVATEDELAGRAGGGLRGIARELNLSRQTVYNRLDELVVAGAA